MKEKKEKSSCGKMKWFMLKSALTVAGFVILPSLIKKYGNKVYKKSLNTEDIDFDEMGPKIVPFDEETKEKNNGGN